MSFQLVLPKNIIFGRGTYSRLGELCAEVGNRALLVTGKSALRKSGRLDQALGLLNRHGVKVELFEGVGSDPDLHTCDRAIGLARERGTNLVAAVGGGSALDVGKAVAAVVPQPGQLSEYFAGDRKLEQSPLPFLAVPTTAGTGSECTNNAVLTDSDRMMKKSLRDERMVPDVALVDPELTFSVPADVTAQTGMDALTQALECYVSRASNPLSDALALRAIKLIAKNLPDAVADGSRIEAREPVALGSLLTAMVFGNVGLGAVHGLAHPLGILFHIPHGLVCAVLLPHVCQFNLPERLEKFGQVAPLVGASSAEEVPTALRELNRQVGIPETFTGYGVNETAFDRILADCRSGSMAKNPRPALDEDLREILRKVV